LRRLTVSTAGIEEIRIAEAAAGSEWITLAVVIKTQGRRGEVAVESHSDVPDRFQPEMKLWALAKDDRRREVVVEDLWPHKQFLVLKFESIDTISDAETLVGAELQLPRSERAELEAGWTYLSDLVGCTLFDADREIGKIEDVRFGAGEAPLLVVRGGTAKFEYEIPFAEAYLVNVDPAKKEIRMNLPEGLLEVNAPVKPEKSAREKKS
jgi:16S rRNA processing protein RimM